MAISLRAVTASTPAGVTTTAGTTSITPTLPSGTAIGDRVFVFQAGSNTAGTTPTGWTAIFKDLQVGVTGTAPGAGTGRRFISAYYRDRDTTWSMPAFTLTSAQQNSHAVTAISLQKAADETWDAPTIAGPAHYAPGTAGTAYSVTSPSWTVATGAWIFSVTGLNDNVSSGSPSGTTTGGIVLGTRTERYDNGTATGNDVRLVVADAPVTTGGTGTISRTATLSGASQGGTEWVQQTVTGPAAPKIHTFVEKFDTALTGWTDPWGSNPPTTSGGKATFTTTTNYEFLHPTGAAKYDATDSSITFNIEASSTAPGATGSDLSMGLSTTSDHSGVIHSWLYSRGNGTSDIFVRAEERPTAGGTLTVRAQGNIPMGTKHLRIREAAGTTFWEYSADAVNWTIYHQKASNAALTAVQPFFMWGRWDAAQPNATFVIEGVNQSPPRTPPTLVATYGGTAVESAPAGASSETVSVTAGAGDLLVAVAGTADAPLTFGTPTGGGLTWELKTSQATGTSSSHAYIWTAVSPTAQTFTLTFPTANGATSARECVIEVFRYSGHDGIGAAAGIKQGSGVAPSLDITTLADDSAIVVGIADWDATSTAQPVWRTGAGPATPQMFLSTSAMRGFMATYADADGAGTKTVGLTAPTNLRATTVAVEVKGAITVASGPPAAGGGEGSFAFTSSGRGARQARGIGGGSYTFTGSGRGARLSRAAGSNGFTFTGSGRGARPARAAGAGTYTFASSGRGWRVARATGTGGYTFTSTGSGRAVPRGTGSGSYGFTSTGAGRAIPRGTGSGNFSFTGTGRGARIARATGNGSWSFTSTGRGSRAARGAGSASWSFSGAGRGSRAARGLGGGTYTWTGSGVGQRPGIAAANGGGAGTFTFTASGRGQRASRARGSNGFVFTGSGRGARSAGAAGQGSFSYQAAGLGARSSAAGGEGGVLWIGYGEGAAAALGGGEGSYVYTGRGHGGIPGSEQVTIPITGAFMSDGTGTAEIGNDGVFTGLFEEDGVGEGAFFDAGQGSAAFEASPAWTGTFEDGGAGHGLFDSDGLGTAEFEHDGVGGGSFG